MKKMEKAALLQLHGPHTDGVCHSAVYICVDNDKVTQMYILMNLSLSTNIKYFVCNV